MLLYIVILITIAAVFFIVSGFGRMMSMTDHERRLLERATGRTGKNKNKNDISDDLIRSRENERVKKSMTDSASTCQVSQQNETRPIAPFISI